MLAVGGLALVIAVFWLLAEAGRANAREVVAAANRSKDPKAVGAAAVALAARGYPETAAVLAKRAVALKDGAGDPVLRSPLPEATDMTWMRFVGLMAGPRADAKTPGGYLGLFAFGLARLADLGYVRNVKRKSDGRVTADWVPPLSEAKFLADEAVQYAAFVKAVEDDRKYILEKHPRAIGKTVAGKVATLSGLLTVAKQAGHEGFTTWLEEEGDEKKFPRTTAAFAKANGLF